MDVPPFTEAQARRLWDAFADRVICATCRCTAATYHLCPMSDTACDGFRTLEVARLGAHAAGWPLDG